MAYEARKRVITVAVLGTRKVGKTAFVTSFLDGSFTSENIRTETTFYTSVLRTADGDQRQIEIIDQSGREKMTEKIDENMGVADAFLVLYSVDKKKSLKKAIRMCQDVCCIHGTRQVPLILIGHKADKNKRKSGNLIKVRQRYCHMYASAKSNLNVNAAFTLVVEMFLSKASNDEMDAFDTWASSQSVDSICGIHMPPKRISKYAIPELMGEDKVRRLNQKDSSSDEPVSECSEFSRRINAVFRSTGMFWEANKLSVQNKEVDVWRKTENGGSALTETTNEVSFLQRQSYSAKSDPVEDAKQERKLNEPSRKFLAEIFFGCVNKHGRRKLTRVHNITSKS